MRDLKHCSLLSVLDALRASQQDRDREYQKNIKVGQRALSGWWEQLCDMPGVEQAAHCRRVPLLTKGLTDGPSWVLGSVRAQCNQWAHILLATADD